jgi:hypothetical protein
MIITYNQVSVFNNLDLIRSAGYIINEDLVDQYKHTCMPDLAAMIDRTGTIEPFLPLTYRDPIPKFNSSFNKTFSQICTERALELLDTKKILNVFWSGGIDSTVVLLSLLSQARNSNQIRVIATHTSIVESGPIFDNHIKNRVSLLLNSSTTREYFYSSNHFDCDNELFITGECADQMVVQNFKIPINKEDYFLPWQEVVETGKSSIDIKKIEFIRPCLENSPRPIKTYRDLLWYYRFNFLWTNSKYSSCLGTDPKYHPVVFFDTKDFQQWSIHDEEEMEDPYTQKHSYKKFIYEQTRNKEYSFKKPKTASSAWINSMSNYEVFLMSDGTTKTVTDIYKELKGK